MHLLVTVHTRLLPPRRKAVMDLMAMDQAVQAQHLHPRPVRRLTDPPSLAVDLKAVKRPAFPVEFLGLVSYTFKGLLLVSTHCLICVS